MVDPGQLRAVVRDLTWYLVTTVLLLTLVAPAEHRFGAAKTGLLLLITQIVGTFAGSALVQLGSLAGDEWTEQLAAGVTVGAGPAAVGVGLAMTSRLSTLWRRRLRLLLLLALLLLVAYSGTLPDVLRLAAGLTGLLPAPCCWAGPRGPRPWSPPAPNAASWSPWWWRRPRSARSSPPCPTPRSDRCRCCATCCWPRRPTPSPCNRSAPTRPPSRIVGRCAPS